MSTPALLAVLLGVFAVIALAVVRLVRRHSGHGPRHGLYRPDLRRSRLRHLIRRDLP